MVGIWVNIVYLGADNPDAHSYEPSGSPQGPLISLLLLLCLLGRLLTWHALHAALSLLTRQLLLYAGQGKRVPYHGVSQGWQPASAHQ